MTTPCPIPHEVLFMQIIHGFQSYLKIIDPHSSEVHIHWNDLYLVEVLHHMRLKR